MALGLEMPVVVEIGVIALALEVAFVSRAMLTGTVMFLTGVR